MSKVLLSVPDGLLVQIDAEASRRSISRSAFLAEAARRKLGRSRPASFTDAITRSEACFATAGSVNAADLVRADPDQVLTRLLVDGVIEQLGPSRRRPVQHWWVCARDTAR
jgi:hypothetical protein